MSAGYRHHGYCPVLHISAVLEQRAAGAFHIMEHAVNTSGIVGLLSTGFHPRCRPSEQGLCCEIYRHSGGLQLEGLPPRRPSRFVPYAACAGNSIHFYCAIAGALYESASSHSLNRCWNTGEEYPASQSELLNYPALEFKDGGTYPRRSRRKGTERKSPRRLRGSITGTRFPTRNSTR